jgi:hypothetical protein
LRIAPNTAHVRHQPLLQFAQARDRLQFHSPNNVSGALGVEAGELLEHFQC